MLQSATISRAADTVLIRCCATRASTVGTRVMSVAARSSRFRSRGHCRAARRLAANCGSFLLSFGGCGGCSPRWHAYGQAGILHLAAALTWAASRDEAMVINHLVNIGRRNAWEELGLAAIQTGWYASCASGIA